MLSCMLTVIWMSDKRRPRVPLLPKVPGPLQGHFRSWSSKPATTVHERYESGKAVLPSDLAEQRKRLRPHKVRAHSVTCECVLQESRVNLFA